MFYMCGCYCTSVWWFCFLPPHIAWSWPWWGCLCWGFPWHPRHQQKGRSAGSHCLAIVQAGMTHLQWKAGFPLLPPLFLLFCKQAVCCESSAELMPSGQKLWKRGADGVPRVQQQPGWCLQLRVDTAGQATRKARGTARWEEGKDQDRGEKGAGTPSRIKGCCHKSLSVTEWDHLSLWGRFP